MDWLMAVAAAAPTSPQRSTPTNRASSAILATPAATVTASPSFGFSAVMKKLWNSYCRINAGSTARMMRPYTTQLSSISPSAPSHAPTGRIATMPSAPITMPHMAET